MWYDEITKIGIKLTTVMKNKNPKDKDLTLSANVLLYLFTAFDFLPRPFEYKTHYLKRLLSGRTDYKSYLTIINRLEKRGLITIFKKKKQKFLKITKKGESEALFIKAKIQTPLKWDGKWRVIVFDIPEDAREKRDQLRHLLKSNGYKNLQASVFISPYPLNREAITYLYKTGLNHYIRVLRVDEIDNDKDLRKRFAL